MFKKVFAFLGFVTLLFTSLQLSVLASDFEATFITSIDYNIGGSSTDQFDPRLNNLDVTVTFDHSNDIQLNGSTGHVKIKSGDKVVKTLANWTNGGYPTTALTWDGKSNDGSGDALSVCPTPGDYCNDGAYKTEVYVKYSPLAGTNLIDTETKDLTVLSTPAIDITNLTVDPASFNPNDQETVDIGFTTSADGFFTVEIKDGATVVDTIFTDKQLTAGTYNKAVDQALMWDGQNANNQIVANKDYSVKVSSKAAAGGVEIDAETINVNVDTPSTISVSQFEFNPTPFDPSDDGNDDTLVVNYALNKQADSVIIEVTNTADTILKSYTAGTDAEKLSGSYTWDGKFGSKYLEPGDYDVTIKALKTGETTVTQTKTLTVSYTHANKGKLEGLTVTPSTFDSDVEDATIEFENKTTGYITVEIRDSNGVKLRGFTDFKHKEYNSLETHQIVFDGENDSGNKLSETTYRVVAVIRNDYGVSKYETNVIIDNSGGNIPSENDHIQDIRFSPSSTFEPADDDELEVKFDVKKDLDSIKIEARRGGDIIEFYDDTNVDDQDNLMEPWDGRDDDDDYVDEGTWRIVFTTVKDGKTLEAEKRINVDYKKPEIDDFLLSKDEFDPDQDEFTHIIFRVDMDAIVDIWALQDNEEDDEIVEDMDVEEDLWYAIEWDGGSYDYDDDLDIKIIAKNTANEDISDSETENVDLDEEDDGSSRKSNITNDYISPVITEGEENMIYLFNLEDDADITLTIRKGATSSGSTVLELVDDEEFFSGEHEIVWNGKNKNGNKLSKGIYNYKIVSKLTSTETETGLFVVGDLGEIEGEASGGGGSNSSSSSSSNSGKVNSNVISINGGDDGGGSSNSGGSSFDDECAGFWDVTESSDNCDAIEWAKAQGIFEGYSDGSFKPFQPINRVETLKVLLEANENRIAMLSDDGGTQGFVDVERNAWYMRYVRTGKSLGIFVGDAGKNTARPDDTVNRVELLKMIFETLSVAKNYNTGSCTDVFNDVSTGIWYYNYACEAKELNLFDGNYLNPSNLSTRGEVARGALSARESQRAVGLDFFVKNT